MKTLQEILGSKKRVELDFIDMIRDESLRDGSMILHLVLAAAIPVVYGRNITDNVSGETVTLQANEVERISIGAEAIDAINAAEAEYKAKVDAGDVTAQPVFIWKEEGKSGKLICDLKLDVSGQGAVWVVKTGFAQFGRQQRTQRNNQQNSALVAKIQAAKTKTEFKDVDVAAEAGVKANKAKPATVTS